MRLRLVLRRGSNAGSRRVGIATFGVPRRRLFDVRLGRKVELQVRRRQTQVDSVPRQYFTEITAINYGERIKTEDAGNQSLGFDVGQAAGADCEFIVSVPFGDTNAGAFHFPHGKAKAFAQTAQVQSSGRMAILPSGGCIKMLPVSCVPQLDARLYFALTNPQYRSGCAIALAIRSVCAPQLPAEPGKAANDKLKFTRLQRTFIPGSKLRSG